MENLWPAKSHASCHSCCPWSPTGGVSQTRPEPGRFSRSGRPLPRRVLAPASVSPSRQCRRGPGHVRAHVGGPSQPSPPVKQAGRGDTAEWAPDRRHRARITAGPHPRWAPGGHSHGDAWGVPSRAVPSPHSEVLHLRCDHSFPPTRALARSLSCPDCVWLAWSVPWLCSLSCVFISSLSQLTSGGPSCWVRRRNGTNTSRLCPPACPLRPGTALKVANTNA